MDMKSTLNIPQQHKYIQRVALCFLGVILLTTQVFGQATYKVVQAASKIAIKGTSNLHEWESNAEKFTGEISATIEGSRVKQISSASIKIVVNSIKSGKSIMDSKTMDALKSEKFPQITFQSTEINLSGTNNISSVGQLTIAGMARKVTILSTYSLGKDQSIIVKGVAKITMSDFKISPPTAMMGMLKTGDETEIVFEVTFK